MTNTTTLTLDQISVLTGPNLVRAVCVHVMGLPDTENGAALPCWRAGADDLGVFAHRGARLLAEIKWPIQM